MSAKIAFIGLGVMGFPMAGHLKAKGYDVTVFNRNAAKAEEWVKKHGWKSAPTPAAAERAAHQEEATAAGIYGIIISAAVMATATRFTDRLLSSTDDRESPGS